MQFWLSVYGRSAEPYKTMQNTVWGISHDRVYKSQTKDVEEMRQRIEEWDGRLRAANPSYGGRYFYLLTYDELACSLTH